MDLYYLDSGNFSLQDIVKHHLWFIIGVPTIMIAITLLYKKLLGGMT